MKDISFSDPDEALDTLRSRTSRLLKVETIGKRFHLRYREMAFRGVSLSRTVESRALFHVGEPLLPVIFFPCGRATTIIRSGRETPVPPGSTGAFTVIGPACFRSEGGYSELVLKVAPDLLRNYLALLEVDTAIPTVLQAAALRFDLPGMGELRRLVWHIFADREGSGNPYSELFRRENDRLQEEALALRVAAVLAGLLHPPDRRAPPHPALGRALDFIATRFTEPLLLADIAAAGNISIRRLQALFREHRGCTPGEHIRNLRLEHAHRLLSRRLVERVTDAALGSGFLHFGEFSAAYARRFGENPSSTLRAG